MQVEITSADLSVALTKAVGEVMPMTFASAFSEDKEQSEKQSKNNDINYRQKLSG